MYILIHRNYTVYTDDTAITDKHEHKCFVQRKLKKLPNVSLLVSFCPYKNPGISLNVTNETAKH